MVAQRVEPESIPDAGDTVSVAEFAMRCGMTVGAVYSRVKRGVLPTRWTTIDGRSGWRIPASEVDHAPRPAPRHLPLPAEPMQPAQGTDEEMFRLLRQPERRRLACSRPVQGRRCARCGGSAYVERGMPALNPALLRLTEAQ